MTILPDALSRETALDPSRSFIVEAPAGSGKTELLVQRFLSLLKSVDQPEAILAITFTRKAASEMKERILKNLTDCGALSQIDVLEDRLRIMTIDAFCKEVVNFAPLQNQLFAAELVEDESAFASSFLERLLEIIESEAEGAEDLVRLFQYFDNQLEETARLLLKLLQNREEWLSLVLDAKRQGTLTAILERSIGALHQEALQGLGIACSIASIKEEIPLLFTQKLTLRKRVPPELKKRAEDLQNNSCLRDAYINIAHLPMLDFKPHDILPVLLRLLPLVAAHLKLLLIERNETDFHEIALTAFSLLQDEEQEVLRQLDAEITHILVDEFQDTSNLQFEMLKLLTREWQEGDGHSLFLVGDPRQSIYRFRDAEVSLFLDARDNGMGRFKLCPLQLRSNFRTDAKLLDWINQSCLNFFPATESERLGKITYVESIAAKPSEAGSIELLSGRFSPISEAFFEDALAEANWIATEVTVVLQQHTEAKIAVLVRARSHYQALITAFESSGILYTVAGDRRWLNSVFLDDLLNLLYAVSQPQDELAWMALLRSPFCGWSLQQIYDFKLKNCPWWEALPAFEFFVTGNGAQYNLYQKFIEVCAILPCRYPPHYDAEIERRLLHFLIQLQRVPEQTTLREQLGRFDFGGENFDAPVTLLTIHQAKGLEFDYVFLPQLHRRVARTDPPLLYTHTFYHDNAFHFLLAERKSKGGESSSLYQYIHWIEEEKLKFETMRLLYVALTRAKRGLFLSAVLPTKSEDTSQEPKIPKGSFLSLLEQDLFE